MDSSNFATCTLKRLIRLAPNSVEKFRTKVRGTTWRRTLFRAASAASFVLLAACNAGGGGHAAKVTAEPNSGLSPTAGLGKKIFSDETLSASGRQSCATCHSPDHAHAQPNNLAVQPGGTNLDRPGFRAVPSLRYLDLNPAFSFSDEGTPTGGFNRDGRAQTLAAQAQRPFLAQHEMANANKEEVIKRLRRASYFEEFRNVFGSHILEHPDEAFDRLTFALQQFQVEAPEFHPFNSRYDQFLAGKATLNDAEQRGLAIFNDPEKGNCFACHPSAKGADGTPPLFTDFTFDNLGVPRNSAIAANRDSTYFDLGLCGPDRIDLAAQAELCGAFKVPTLRNVATRKVFFHNGAFTSQRDAVSFYARRDTHPGEWYPAGPGGAPQKFNDLPQQYRDNVNTDEVPYDRLPGMMPALSAADIDDLVRFLETLTDLSTSAQ
ncbi:MAG: c-type cytochrome [Herminiimonas sp.]|nr:c-type cytochrome [Herminiimonas sp.]